MPYDEGLVQRIREFMEDIDGVVEKPMFGGITFMVNGHMTVGVDKDKLLVRVGKENYGQFVKDKYAKPMDFTGRTMKGFIFVSEKGIQEDEDLEKWITRALDYTTTLPPK